MSGYPMNECMTAIAEAASTGQIQVLGGIDDLQHKNAVDET